MDEHQVSDLLNNGQRIGQPAGPEGLPERVDLVFQFAGDHSWPRLSQFVEFKEILAQMVEKGKWKFRKTE